jgi:hypothetical protein
MRGREYSEGIEERIEPDRAELHPLFLFHPPFPSPFINFIFVADPPINRVGLQVTFAPVGKVTALDIYNEVNFASMGLDTFFAITYPFLLSFSLPIPPNHISLEYVISPTFPFHP